MLNIGEALAPNVVRGVKEYLDPGAINIIDASPGTACPVVETVKGSDVLLLVTEPTPFGLHDLSFAVRLGRKLELPMAVVINRADMGNSKIVEYCNDQGIPVVLTIPEDRAIAEAYARGVPAVKASAALQSQLLGMAKKMQQGLSHG